MTQKEEIEAVVVIPSPLVSIGEEKIIPNYRTNKRIDNSISMEVGVCTSLSYQANQFHNEFEWYYSFTLKRVSKTGNPIILNYKHSELKEI